MADWILDFDGCGDGDRGLQALVAGTTLPAWTGAFYSVSTGFGAFGYGTQILQGGHAERWFTPQQHPVVGFHMNSRVRNNPNTGHEVRFREGSLVCMTLKFPESGAILVYDASGVLQGTIPAGTWPASAWAYIEVECNVVESDGDVSIWLFGNNSDVPDLVVAGLDTVPAGGTGVCDNIQWHGIAGNTHWIDDWYLVDGDIVAIGLGGVVIGAQAPNGDDLAEWTPSAGGGNFQQVNERPFSATDAVSTAVDGDKDRYTIAASGDPAEVFGVRVIGQLKKTDVAIAKARLLIDDDGTQGDGATRTLSTSTQVVADVFARRPSDDSQWDEASVDAVLIGVERVAP